MAQNDQALAIVEAWQAAANQRDIERLLTLSAPNITIIGPRGTGYGHELLRDWVSRAGLSLSTLRIFARGDAVVVAQHGVWRAVETGEMIGESPVATSFLIADRRVAEIGRYDGLDEALTKAGLSYADEVVLE